MLLLGRNLHYMKKLLITALAGIILSSCTDTKDQQKTLLNDVIKIHDKVMNNEDHLMQNKMKLDTLLLKNNFQGVKDTAAEKVQIRALNAKLVSADGAMENWMQKFDPEQKGKSNAEIITYLTDQKKQVLAVDSQLNVAVKESSEYLSHLKK
jgi:hypothetical protein